MKHLLVILLCLPVMLFGQEENQPNLYEVVNIQVKAGQDDAFKAAVKAHNEKFHGADGLYRAFLTYNVNGPLAGHYSWIMGPMNWAAMENRPGKGAHDDDWAVVDQYIESLEGPTYWTVPAGISYNPNRTFYSKRLIWMYDIKRGQSARWSELLGKIKKVYEEKRPDESYWVAWNEFADTKKGWDVALIWGFEDWAWMDRQSNFGADYEAVHGNGSWHNFLNEFRETVDGRVDWLREVVE